VLIRERLFALPPAGSCRQGKSKEDQAAQLYIFEEMIKLYSLVLPIYDIEKLASQFLFGPDVSDNRIQSQGS
jgi:hypothetical protein